MVTFKSGKVSTKAAQMINENLEELENFDWDVDALAERYIACLLIIADEQGITPNEVHNGVSSILETVQIETQMTNSPETDTKH